MKNLLYGEKHSFIKWTYDVDAQWYSLYETIPMCTTTYVTEIKESILKYTLNKYQVHLAFLFLISQTAIQY